MTNLYNSDDSNLSLPVLPELPDGYTHHHWPLDPIQEAYNRTPQDGRERHYTYCPKCEGWIPGLHRVVEHNSLSNQLSGRKGKAYHCRRCGYEIGFDGAIA